MRRNVEQQKTPQMGKFRMSMAIPQSEKHNAGSSGRFSLAATANSARRQSFFKPATIRDSRPITSKEYQVKMCQRIHAFLIGACGMEDLPEKVVKQPQKADFIMIFEAIFQNLDSTFQLGPKIEEEVPQLFRLLGYPTQIKSSTMATIGAAHSLPHLWAALSWLIGYVEISEKILPSDILLAEQCDGKVAALSYMIDQSAFKEHYKEGVPETDEFVEKYMDRFRTAIHDQCGVDGRLKEINAGKENFIKEIEMLKADCGREETLRREVQSLKSDYQTQLRYVKEIQDALPAYERAMAEAQEALEISQRKKFEIQEQVEMKKELIRKQNEGHGLSGEAARQLIQEINENKEIHMQLQQEMNDIGKELWKEKPRVDKLFKQQLKSFRTWHESMVALERSINVTGMEFEIDSEEPAAVGAKELLALLNGYAKKACWAIEKRISVAEREIEEITSRKSAEVKRLRECCADQESRLSQLARDEQREERQRKREKEDWKSARQKLDREIENLARDKEMFSDRRHEMNSLKYDLEMAKIALSETEKNMTQLRLQIVNRCQEKIGQVYLLHEKMQEERNRMEQAFRDIGYTIERQVVSKKNPMIQKNDHGV